MVNQQLVDYINSETSKSIPKEIIISNLTSQGWSVVDVNEAYRLIEIGASVISSPSQSTAETKEYLTDVKYFWIGVLGTCLLMVFTIYRFFSSHTNLPLSLEVMLIISMFLLIFLTVCIFHEFTKLVKVPMPSWRKALFMLGIGPILGAVVFFIIQFLLISTPFLYVLLVGVILSISCFFISIAIAQKVYRVKFLKGLLLTFALSFSMALSAILVVIANIFFVATVPPPKHDQIPEQSSSNVSTLDINVVAQPEVSQSKLNTNNSLSDFSTWKNFPDKSRGFSLTFPTSPTTTVLSKDKVNIETIESVVGNFKYSLDYMVFPNDFYKAGDSITTKEEKGVNFYLTMLAIFYGKSLQYTDAPSIDGHLTKSFTISAPDVRFVGNVTATTGKAYAYSTECDGINCPMVPLQDEFIKSFKLLTDKS